MIRLSHLATLTALIALPGPAAVCAQERARIGLDTVVSVDRFVDSAIPAGVGVTFDSLASFRIGGSLFGVVRPTIRRMSDRQWSWQVCQVAVRYESAVRLPIRVEFGQIASPVGLGTLEARADDNPTIKPQLYYHEPIPEIEFGAPPLQVMSSVYPFGAQVSVSRDHWDMRVAVVDSSVVRPRKVIARKNPPRMPQVAVGGGFTPVAGMRIGASFMRGPYRRANELREPTLDDRTATILGIEGEYAIRHTKISGEWVRDSFETVRSPAVAHGWFLEGLQTLTPQWFAAFRTLGVNAVRHDTNLAVRPVSLRSVETVVGYRLTPALTIRGGHFGRKSYGAAQWDHQIGVSLVWARRWF